MKLGGIGRNTGEGLATEAFVGWNSKPAGIQRLVPHARRNLQRSFIRGDGKHQLLERRHLQSFHTSMAGAIV
jgi:hypothetical protein